MMVDFFRRKMKAFIWLIIASFVLSIFFIAAGSFWESGRADQIREEQARNRKAEEQKGELDFSLKTPVATISYKGQTETITEGELNRAVTDARNNNQMYRQSSASLATFKTMMGPVILDNLVKQRLVMMEAESLKVDVSKDVQDEIDRNVAKAGSKEKLLEAIHMSEADLRKLLERQLKQNRIIRTVTGGKQVADKAIEDYYTAHQAEFKGKDGKVRPLTEVRSDIEAKLRSQITQADVQAYYEAHKARWKNPDKVTVRHLALDPGAERWKKQVKVTDEEIAKYYQEHASDYKAPKRVRLAHIFLDPKHESFKDAASVDEAAVRKAFDEKTPPENPTRINQITIGYKGDQERTAARDSAEKARERLEAGEAFAAVASSVTTGELKEKGGDRGVIRPGQLPEPLSSTARELTTGQISPVIPAEGAFHIVQVVEKLPIPAEDPEREKEFQAKRQELQSDLELAKREEAARTKLADLAKSLQGAEATTGAFETAAKANSHAKSGAEGGHLGIVALGLNKDNPLIDEIGAKGYVDETITDIVTELKPGEVSRPVKSALGFHIVKLEEELPAANKPLAEVKTEVADKLVAQKTEQAVIAAAERIRKELTGKDKKRPFAEIVNAESDGSDAKDGGLWKDVLLSSEETPNVSDTVKQETFSLRGLNPKIVDALVSLEKGQVSETVVLGRSRHIFLMEDRHPASYNPLDEKVAAEIRETLNPEVTDEEVRAYFDEHKDEFEEPAKVTLQHVLVPDEEQAKEVLAQALKGESFDYLAKKYSRDPASKEKGGTIQTEIGSPAIRQVVQKMTPGQVHPELVKSHVGWHVLKLVSRDAAKPASLEAAKPKIREKLLPEKREKVLRAWLEELENQAVIKKQYGTL